MRKKAILFDLDNTLFEEQNTYDLAMYKVHNVLNKSIEIDFKEFRSLYKLSKEEIAKELFWTASSRNKAIQFQRLIEKIYDTIDTEIILDLYETFWESYLENIHLREWVLDILKYCKKKWIRTGIISNLTTHIQLKKINKLWLSSYIDQLVTSEEAWSEKPNAEIFLLALNKLKCIPEETIMIWDDLVNDIEWANALWIETILITKEHESKSIGKEDYKKPNHTIRFFKEILEII